MKFFRELYQGADEDTRRAMIKSMQESGGGAAAAALRACVFAFLSCEGVAAEPSQDLAACTDTATLCRVLTRPRTARKRARTVPPHPQAAPRCP